MPIRDQFIVFFFSVIICLLLSCTKMSSSDLPRSTCIELCENFQKGEGFEYLASISKFHDVSYDSVVNVKTDYFYPMLFGGSAGVASLNISGIKDTTIVFLVALKREEFKNLFDWLANFQEAEKYYPDVIKDFAYDSVLQSISTCFGAPISESKNVVHFINKQYLLHSLIERPSEDLVATVIYRDITIDTTKIESLLQFLKSK